MVREVVREISTERIGRRLLSRHVILVVAFHIATCVPARAQLAYDAPYSFTTLAGSARTIPCSTATTLCGGGPIDSTGTMWAVGQNGALSKIAPNGTITAFVPSSDSDPCPGLSAGVFASPRDLAIDRFDNVYVTEVSPSCARVRKITPSGVVITLAGAPGQADTIDGVGAAARFYSQSGIAVDYWGVLYVTQNHGVVRSITPDGRVTTIAGASGQYGSQDGVGSAARFRWLGGVAADWNCEDARVCSATVWVADNGNHTIRRLQSNQPGSILDPAIVTTTAGSPGSSGYVNGYGNNARFTFPLAIAAAGGAVFVGEADFTVRRLNPVSGEVTTFAGSPGRAGVADGIGVAARFSNPPAAFFARQNTLIVTGGTAIRRVDLSTAAVTTLGMVSSPSIGYLDGPGADARFYNPTGVAVDESGTVYVADYWSHTIRKIANGIVSTFAGRPAAPGSQNGAIELARLEFPYQVAIGPDGTFYVAETWDIRRISPDGVVSTFASFGSYGIAVDANSVVYASRGCAIVKILRDGSVTTLAGSIAECRYQDGSGGAARFSGPHGLAVSASGDVYVADGAYHANGAIRRISPDGSVTTVAGGGDGCARRQSWTHDSIVSRDGPAASACFSRPEGIAVDSLGRIYVSDRNHLIRRIADGTVTTLGGVQTEINNCSQPYPPVDTYIYPGSDGQNGVGSAAHFCLPQHIAVDASGSVYVADYSDNTIRLGVSSPQAPAFTVEPNSRVVTVGQRIQFTVAATGTPSPGYTWQVSTDGGSTWANLSEAAPYTGTGRATLTIVTATASISGRRFRCIATNAFGTATSQAAALMVSDPHMALDTPNENAHVTQPFAASGWGIDAGATSGTGVDTVHVWAHPLPSGAPILLGANYGGSRPDVALVFGARFNNSGFNVTVSGLSPGRYRITAIGRNSVTGMSDLTRSKDITVLGERPTDLRVTAIVGNTVTIDWTPSAGTPSGYVVEGGTSPGAVLASLPTGSTATTFTFTAPTGAFYIRVHALTGITRSEASNEVRIFVGVPPPPSAPTGLLGLVNGSSLALSWLNTSAGGPPTSVQLNVTGSVAGTLSLPTSESFSLAAVPAGTYTLTVTAVNASGNSEPSNPVTLTVPGPCSGVPSTPRNFAVRTNGREISLSWDPPTNGPAVTGYLLRVGGAFVGNLQTTERAMAGTVGPGSYSLSVAAINACGSGAPTATQTIVVP